MSQTQCHKLNVTNNCSHYWNLKSEGTVNTLQCPSSLETTLIENKEPSEGVANSARYLIALNSNVGLVIQKDINIKVHPLDTLSVTSTEIILSAPCFEQDDQRYHIINKMSVR